RPRRAELCRAAPSRLESATPRKECSWGHQGQTAQSGLGRRLSHQSALPRKLTCVCPGRTPPEHGKGNAWADRVTERRRVSVSLSLQPADFCPPLLAVRRGPETVFVQSWVGVCLRPLRHEPR